MKVNSLIQIPVLVAGNADAACCGNGIISYRTRGRCGVPRSVGVFAYIRRVTINISTTAEAPVAVEETP